MTKKITAVAIALLFAYPQAIVLAEENSQVTIKDYLEKSLPAQEGRKITYGEGTKLLTVTDTKSNHDLIKRLIKDFEVGPKQVMIETRFVEVDITDLEELGIEWDFFLAGNTLKNGPGSIRVGQEMGADGSVVPYKGIHWNDNSTTPFPKVGNLAGQFMLFKMAAEGAAGADYLMANLRALAQKGRVNLLSAPKVTTISGQMANIQVMRTYPYVSEFTLENIGTAEFPTWSYKLKLAEKSIGILLEATPYVTEDSSTVTLDLHPEVSVLQDQIAISTLQLSGETGTLGNVTATGGTVALINQNLGWPVVDIRTMQTSVVVESGETIVLGGMLKDEEVAKKKKIPLLGDIPLIGGAFQYDYKDQRKKSLLIFITASIIDANGKIIR